jgi:hypothetical protein
MQVCAPPGLAGAGLASFAACAVLLPTYGVLLPPFGRPGSVSTRRITVFWRQKKGTEGVHYRLRFHREMFVAIGYECTVVRTTLYCTVQVTMRMSV